MRDLISRQAAINATWEEPSYKDPLNVLAEMRDRTKTLPSAEPEIIYCKDCRHNMKSSEAGNACCDIFYGMTNQYGFCHMGERRTDG